GAPSIARGGRFSAWPQAETVGLKQMVNAMRNDHITSLLEKRSIRELSDAEIAIIQSHAAGCADCRRAYAAASLGQSLLRARAADQAEVSPFFKTRVMAAIRERRLSPEMPALLRLWKAAGVLVSTMAALLVLLFGLTIFTSSSTTPQLAGSRANESIYSTEAAVLEA